MATIDDTTTAPDDRRVVVITGSTGALGRAVAAAFAADGHRLVLVGRDAGRLEELAQDLELPAADWAPSVADLRTAAGGEVVARTSMERFGRIDVLLHLVGGYEGGVPLVDLEPDTLASMLDQHVWSTFHIVRAVTPAMIERGWGRVLAVVVTATANPPPKLGAYVTAKAAQETLLRVLAREVAATGVTVNVLAVKAIDTAHARETEPSTKNAGWTTPEEIAATMRLLCSDAGATINGARIPLDGRG